MTCPTKLHLMRCLFSKIVTVSQPDSSDFSSNGTIFPAMEVRSLESEFLLSSTLPYRIDHHPCWFCLIKNSINMYLLDISVRFWETKMNKAVSRNP